MIVDYFRLVTKSFLKRKLRSWLTIIGILIGITAIVALISLGQGMNVAVNELFESIGSDKVIISPGGAFLGPTGATLTSAEITEYDLDLIEDTRGIEKVIGLLIQRSKVKFHDQTKFTSVVGISTDKEITKILDTIDFYKIQKGRQLKDGDKNKAVIGNVISDDFFDKPIGLNGRIEIDGKSYQVVGIQKKSGSPVHDRMVRVSLESAREILDEPESFSIFIAQVKKGFSPAEVSEDIEKAMRKDRDLEEGEEDFSVEVAETLVSGVNNVLGVVQIALIGIASISIVVGGIGIMNATYTSVFERTNEIGIMKALGAKNRDIVLIFLIEAGVLGLVGGMFGVVFGSILAKLVELVAANLGADLLKAAITPSLIIGALLFSFVVGAVSGVLPALKASKLNVIEAIGHG